MSKYCIDTHALVWYVTGQKTLSNAAKTAIDAVFTRKAEGYLSAIIFLELLHLSFKQKQFTFPKLLQELRRPNIFIVSVDQDILKVCYTLSHTLDIHDRIIAATTLVTKSKLITKDPLITKSLKTSVIW